MRMKSHDYLTSNILDVIKNIAVYLRKSRGESDEDLERHRGVIVDFCKQYDWNFVEYAEIVSGENIKNRPKIQELLNDVKDEMYDAVFVYDYDRLGRGSGADQETIVNAFKETDTLVIEANPFNVLDPNNERDETMIDFKGFMARQEYKMIRKRLIAGKKISLKMGHWANGFAPYGYEINKDLKKLSIISEQKNIIRRHMLIPYLNGESSAAIARNLKNLNILTNKGINWNSKTILYTLTNKTNIGHTYYNKKDKKGNLKPESEWSVTLNTHEAIFSEEELEQVLSIKNDRQTTGKKTVNALGSLVKCVVCGNTLSIRTQNGAKSINNCTKCKENRGGNLDIIEEAIYVSLKHLKVRLEEGDVTDVKNKRTQNAMEVITRLNNEIKKIEQAIVNIELAFEKGMYDIDKTMERTRMRQNEITQLQKLIKKEKEKSELDNSSEPISLTTVEKMLGMMEQGKDELKLRGLYEKTFEFIIWDRRSWNEVKVRLGIR